MTFATGGVPHAGLQQLLNHVRLFMILQTVSHQAPPTMGILQARILEWVAILFSRGSFQPEIEPRCSELQADALLSEPQGSPYKPLGRCISVVPPWRSKASLSLCRLQTGGGGWP